MLSLYEKLWISYAELGLALIICGLKFKLSVPCNKLSDMHTLWRDIVTTAIVHTLNNSEVR